MKTPIRIENWRFFRGDAEGAYDLNYNDELWREVYVPHDWSIEDVPGTRSPFSATESGGKGATGHAVGGIGWYRTDLELDSACRHRLVFEASFGETDVWIDGVLQVTHYYGYTPFAVEIPAGKERATVAVRVANHGHNCRWYSGSGLYRPVILEALGPVSIAMDGLVVMSRSVTRSVAHIEAIAEVDGACDVRFEVFDSTGQHVSAKTVRAADGRANAEFEVRNPALWNTWDSQLNSPMQQPLFRVDATAITDGGEHRTSTQFGLRDIGFDAAKGLSVNGRRTLLKGGCIHHDHGIIGAAAFDDAEARKVRLLKEAGYNAIRTSHNPPSKAFLDACDRMGMLVIDEVHDEWELPKTPDSYHKHFAEHCEADAKAMVRRDRNRACVWCWSIGNEIPGSFVRPDISLRLREAVLQEDTTRPVTAGLCLPWWPSEGWVDWETTSEPAMRHLDIVGMNYLWDKVRPDHEAHPQRLMMMTESFPDNAWDTWHSVLDCPWNLGDFVWTAQDYIGESGIGQRLANSFGSVDGAFPFHLAVCGDIDLIGERKPQSYYRESLWRGGVLHLTVHVPETLGAPAVRETWMQKWGWDDVQSHWTWPEQEGRILIVEAYTSCEHVELTLNGRVVAARYVAREDQNRVRFDVPYEPGILEARGRDKSRGKVVDCLVTAGAPAQIAARAEPLSVVLHQGALGYVRFEIQDLAGTAVPDADSLIEVAIAGPAVLVGFGNASPTDVDSLTDDTHRTFDGKALLAFRPLGSGIVTVTATSPGLAPATLTIAVGSEA